MADKDHIIAEATKMIIAQGIRSVRMDDIANELGISKRTLYEMFGDKEKLVTECLRWYFDGIGCRYKAQMDQTDNTIARFIVLLQDWDQVMETNMKLMDGVKKFYPKIYEEITLHKQEEKMQELRNQIQKGIEEGLFLPHINADLAVIVFSDSVYGLSLNADKFEERNYTAAQAFKYIVTYFFRGISTEKGIRLLDEYIQKDYNR